MHYVHLLDAIKTFSARKYYRERSVYRYRLWACRGNTVSGEERQNSKKKTVFRLICRVLTSVVLQLSYGLHKRS